MTYDTLRVPDNPPVTLGTVHRAYENEELPAKKHFVFFLNLYEAKTRKDKIVPRPYEGPNLHFATNNDTYVFLPVKSNLVPNCFIIVKEAFFSFFTCYVFSFNFIH